MPPKISLVEVVIVPAPISARAGRIALVATANARKMASSFIFFILSLPFKVSFGQDL